MAKPSEGKLLYHITHLDNMQSIINHGLLSRNALKNVNGVSFVDVQTQRFFQSASLIKRTSQILFFFINMDLYDNSITIISERIQKFHDQQEKILMWFLTGRNDYTIIE